MDAPQDLVARDSNLDSRHDLAVAQLGTFGATPATVVLLNSGSATVCAAPSSANLAARICAPSSQPGSDTITVLASGNSPTGVRRVELWIDGKKKYDSPDDQLQFKLTLAPGTHKLEIGAVDKFGAVAKTKRFVAVP
jgi:hypothetical protein